MRAGCVRPIQVVTLDRYTDLKPTVCPALPVHSVKELIALVRMRPGKLTTGAISAGSQHQAGALPRIQASINFLYVPYKGNGPAMSGLVGAWAMKSLSPHPSNSMR
jgi:tripartite-type tricarboxylate transporter receptor subunit TctC